MLQNSKEILLQAKRDGYALPAPDFIDLNSARVFVRVAEELNRPLLLSWAQVFESFFPLEEAAAVGRALGERASVPVVLHLDHGMDLEHVEKALQCGFTSVMIDASAETIEKNIAVTREAVKLAHAAGATAEAEIGHVGQGENYVGIAAESSVYTQPDEAIRFVRETGVDSLAVSIGTVHGIYKKLEKPVLCFDILHTLAASLEIPLVLHGGSGTGDENLHRCATEGISKINIYTDFLTGAMNRINADKPENYLAVKRSADAGMDEVLRHYFKVFSR